jgi:hypothetical protein
MMGIKVNVERDEETGRVLYREGKCVCGQQIDLSCFTNACSCGRDYNSGGQLLAHRSQWGAETGESVGDILMADSDPFGGDY